MSGPESNPEFEVKNYNVEADLQPKRNYWRKAVIQIFGERQRHR